jgi:hypothetical protein
VEREQTWADNHKQWPVSVEDDRIGMEQKLWAL